MQPKLLHKPTLNIKTFLNIAEREVLMYSNMDLENIVTPVRYAVLEDLLLASNYNKEKSKFLVEGFKE